MGKSVLVIETPNNCLECPMHYKAEEMPLGNFTYQKLFRCKIEPEDIEDVYLSDILKRKPEWCPIKSILKPIPLESADYAHEAAYIKGWNECLEKILELNR